MTKLLDIDYLIDEGGGNTVISREINTTPQAICKWRQTGLVPIERVPVMERLTGIPRHLIRPDRPDLFPPPARKRSCAMETAA